jgi:hypothetical protein
MTTCRDCSADIVWGVTEKGRRIPLNPERHDPGDEHANLAVYRDHLSRLHVRVPSVDRPIASFEWRATPHFATCPPRVAARDAQAGRIPNVVPFRRRSAR